MIIVITTNNCTAGPRAAFHGARWASRRRGQGEEGSATG